MKIFQRYNPLQVAKYVKILFRGRLYIKDVGAFEFDKGKSLSKSEGQTALVCDVRSQPSGYASAN